MTVLGIDPEPTPEELRAGIEYATDFLHKAGYRRAAHALGLDYWGMDDLCEDEPVPFAEVVSEQMLSVITADQEAARQRAELESPPYRWYRRMSGMMIKGTAGRAREWWSEVAAAMPEATPEEVVEAFAERCDAEVTRAPRFYTPRHLRAMIEVAGRLSERVAA